MSYQYSLAIDDLRLQLKRLKEKKSELEEELKYIDNNIASFEIKLNVLLSHRDFDDNNGNRVIDMNDRMRILTEIRVDLPSLYNEMVHKGEMESVFQHCDNIRYVYNESGLKCPQWFKEKYGIRMRDDM